MHISLFTTPLALCECTANPAEQPFSLLNHKHFRNLISPVAWDQGVGGMAGALLPFAVCSAIGGTICTVTISVLHDARDQGPSGTPTVFARLERRACHTREALLSFTKEKRETAAAETQGR